MADGAHSTYDSLPEPVKMHLTKKEWLWLSDGEKERLLEDATVPEWEESR